MGMGRMGQIFSNSFKVAKGSATLAQAIAAATDLPASGSYVNVAGYERVHIIAALGVIHGSDAPTLEPKCSDAVDGTADSIDETNLKHTVDVADDEEFVTWTIEVAKLPVNHHFLLIDVGGTTTNGSYGFIFFLLEGLDLPVTQTTAVLPTASQYAYGG